MKHLKLFNKEIIEHKDAWIIIIFIFIFILLRLPSLIEPYWYGDEGIYQVIGKALSSGRILYQEIWDNKPPLLYYIYAIFNGDQFLVRSFSLLIGGLSVGAFYFLGKEIFKKRKSIIVSTLIYLFFLGSPFIEGNIANAENFMHLPIILAAFFIIKFKKSFRLKYILLSGFLMSIAFSIKIVAIFEFIAFFIFLFVLNKNELIENKLKNLLKVNRIRVGGLYLLGVLILPVLFSLYFLYVNAFTDFLSGVLSENIDYIGVGNNFIFPMGILLIKILITLSLLLIVFAKRKKISRYNLLIYLWLIFSLFSTFFSHRPYFHYVLMSALPFSYLIGSIFEFDKHRLLKIIVAVILMIIIYTNFGIYKKTISYYENYINFVFFNKKINDYQAFFDVNTPRDYELVRFIEILTKDKDSDVFLWSDSGQIYAMLGMLPPGKYIVAYHITYYNNAVSYMIEQISKTKPRYIIRTKDSPEFRNFLPSYVLKYKILNSDIYERQD